MLGGIAAPGFIIGYFGLTPLLKVVMGASVGLGLLVKFALMDPFALTSVIVNYHSAIAGQKVDPAWTRRLEEISGKFKEFNKREKEWAGLATGPTRPASASS